jgi:subtilisin family serine protease
MQKPVTAEDRQEARQDLVAFLLDRLGRDDFVSFLRGHGYGEVVEAIPPSETEVYVEELILGLDRRRRLDGEFFAALSRATGADDRLGRIAAQLGISLAAPIGVEATQDIGADTIRHLVQELLPSEIDQPGLPAEASLGTPWHEALAGHGHEKPSEAVLRLARDQTPTARAALAWVCTLLMGLAPTGSSLLQAARAVAVAAEPTGVADEAAIEWPDSGSGLASDEDILPVRFLARGLDAARGVVLVRVEHHHPIQPVFATGWLLSPRFVVVPSHLFWLHLPPERRDWRLIEEAAAIVVRFDFDDAREGSTLVVRGREIVGVDLGLDLALLSLEEPMRDRPPLQVRPDPIPATSRITLFHHLGAGPKVISLHGGHVVKNDGHEMVYLAATGAGSAGAPIFDDQWRVVGTHRAWRSMRVGNRPDRVHANFGTATPALLRWIREFAGVNGRLWRGVVAAQPDLKTVDATIRHTLAEQERIGLEPRAPFIIRVLDEDTPLDDVPGLIIDSRSGTMVSATGTPQSLSRLAEDPAVLSIEASLPGGAPECWASVPHVGAEAVHTSHGERGDSALIAVIDNGVDVLHETFLDDQHATRIVAFWDQRDGNAPIEHSGRAHAISHAGSRAVEKYDLTYGALYTQEDIQTFVDTQTLPGSFPPRAAMAHGTRVASIAAGRRTGENAETDFGGGVAPAAKLVVVRPDLQHTSIGYAKGYIDALNFVGRLAEHLGLPVVVNISAGMNAGSHDGTSDVEVACEDFLKYGRAPGRVIVKSAGNERQALRHASLEVPQGGEFSLAWRTERKPQGNPAAHDLLELWFPGENSYRFQLVTPSEKRSPTIDPTLDPRYANANEMLENGNRFAMRHRRYHRDNGYGSLRLEIFSDAAEIEPGRWELIIEGLAVIKDEPIHAWIELSNERQTIFCENASDDVTITIPGTAQHVISVGAIEVSDTMRSYKHSSRGPTRGRTGTEKPVIVAPGVDIRACRTGTLRSADRVVDKSSGTSYAAPHVAGAVALILSARAKDPSKPQLNTNQIQSALQRSARHFTGRWHYITGFGALDVQQFMDEIAQMPEDLPG